MKNPGITSGLQDGVVASEAFFSKLVRDHDNLDKAIKSDGFVKNTTNARVTMKIARLSTATTFLVLLPIVIAATLMTISGRRLDPERGDAESILRRRRVSRALIAGSTVAAAVAVSIFGVGYAFAKSDVLVMDKFVRYILSGIVHEELGEPAKRMTPASRTRSGSASAARSSTSAGADVADTTARETLLRAYLAQALTIADPAEREQAMQGFNDVMRAATIENSRISTMARGKTIGWMMVVATFMFLGAAVTVMVVDDRAEEAAAHVFATVLDGACADAAARALEDARDDPGRGIVHVAIYIFLGLALIIGLLVTFGYFGFFRPLFVKIPKDFNAIRRGWQVLIEVEKRMASRGLSTVATSAGREEASALYSAGIPRVPTQSQASNNFYFSTSPVPGVGALGGGTGVGARRGTA